MNTTIAVKAAPLIREIQPFFFDLSGTRAGQMWTTVITLQVSDAGV
jgi:hypothetical protein